MRKKIKILAVIDEPYINTYETLYYEAKKEHIFDFIFVVIKPQDQRMNSSYGDLCKMMKNLNLPYIDGYDEKTGKELDLKTLNPDIVFLQTPYDLVKRSELYSSEYLSSFTKIIHISYGSTIIDYDKPPFSDFKLIESNKFFNRCWFCAIENKMIANQLNKYHKNKFKSFGYIKLDKFLHYNKDSNFKIKSRPNFKHIIAWKPRWFASQGDSNFLTYIDFFKDFAIKNPDVLLLFVLHPLLKDRLITQDIYTKEYVDELFDFFEKQKNIQVICDGDFLDDIYNSDIFIADYCSTITEAAIFDIPIIYTPTVVKLSKFGKKFLQCAYIANDVQEMKFHITNLLNGKDSLNNNRKKFRYIASPKARYGSYAKDLLKYINKYFCHRYNIFRIFHLLDKKTA